MKIKYVTEAGEVDAVLRQKDCKDSTDWRDIGITSPYRPGGRNQSLYATGRVLQRLYDGEIITGNHTLVINEWEENPPLGVITDNAPFIGLMAIAVISGAIGFVKMRKAEYEE